MLTLPPTANRWAAAAAIALVMGASHLLDGQPTELEAEQATADSAQDLAQQAAELRAELRRQQAQHPDLWTPETIAAADRAVALITSPEGVRP